MKQNWQSILRTNFTSSRELADFLELSDKERALLLSRSPFSLNVPRRIAEKMKKGSLESPLARQFLAHVFEEKKSLGFKLDPNDEAFYSLTGKMLKKYSGRALLVTTSACAMHCRYCFRQNYPYEKERMDFSEELSSIREDVSLFEVILSGGDPLSLPDRRLSDLLDGLALIDHIRLIRFHTRFPIGIPERIDDSFLKLLASQKKQIVFVVHVNHASELDREVIDSLKKIQKLGIPVLCQSVLLKEVNDSVDALEDLFRSLILQGIIPYYLHQLDPVSGAEHFEVADATALELMRELKKRLPGYAIPELVREIPGRAHKTAVE